MQYGPDRDHSTWTIRLKRLRDFEQSSFCNLLSRATSEFSADFGFIHYATDLEMPRGIENGSMAYLDVQKKTKYLFVTSHDLWKYIPDIYWMTVFGPCYVDLFSRERLLSCPVHRVLEFENGAVAIQLTARLTDTADDQAAFENLRNEVRAHLNCNAIFDVRKGATHKYTVPEFVWGPLLQ